MRILVAEDDTTSRVLLSSLLTKWGYEVQSVPDGRAAWDALTVEDPAPLVILDWMMPGLDGTELCRRIRERREDRESYVILLTTRGEKDDVVQGFAAGADDYVTKPFDRQELRARVGVGRRILNLSSDLREHVKKLQDALAHIKTLQGIIPICMYCHAIRDDSQAWQRLEAYVSHHSDAQFSHGICPDCLEVKKLELSEQAREEISSDLA